MHKHTIQAAKFSQILDRTTDKSFNPIQRTAENSHDEYQEKEKTFLIQNFDALIKPCATKMNFFQDQGQSTATWPWVQPFPLNAATFPSRPKTSLPRLISDRETPVYRYIGKKYKKYLDRGSVRNIGRNFSGIRALTAVKLATKSVINRKYSGVHGI